VVHGTNRPSLLGGVPGCSGVSEWSKFDSGGGVGLRARHRSAMHLLLPVLALLLVVVNPGFAIRPETQRVVPLREIPEDIFSSEAWAESNYVAQVPYLTQLFSTVEILVPVDQQDLRSELDLHSHIKFVGVDEASPISSDSTRLEAIRSRGLELFPKGSETGCAESSSDREKFVRDERRCPVSVTVHEDYSSSQEIRLRRFIVGDSIWLIDDRLFSSGSS